MTSLPKHILTDLDRMPPLPALVIETLRLLDNPRTSGQQVAAVLGRDPVLAARVLRLANSAWYTWARHISSIQEAVVMVGFATVRSQVLGAAVFDVLRKGAPGYALDQDTLWRHSAAVGATARHLAKTFRRGDIEAAFVAGLLHDIGKVVLSRSLGARYADVMQFVEIGMDFAQAERAVFGCDHAQVGAEAARRWNLPDSLVEAIQYHHRPLDLPTSGHADIVHVADALALTIGMGIGADHLLYPCNEAVLARIGADPAAIDGLLIKLSELLVEVSAPFNLDLPQGRGA